MKYLKAIGWFFIGFLEVFIVFLVMLVTHPFKRYNQSLNKSDQKLDDLGVSE